MHLKRKPLFTSVLVLSFVLYFWLPACSAQAQTGGSGQVLAVVNGKPITDAEVRASAVDQFKALDRQYREQLERSLDQLVLDRLIGVEAAARRITAEALLAQIKPAPVTEADISAFYEQNKARYPSTMSRDSAWLTIRRYLEQQRQGTAREDFLKQLAVKYRVEKKLEPYRIEVAPIGPSRGPANAPVTFVIFSDFEGPFDARFTPTLQQAKVKYGDSIRIVFRQFPLPFHANAQKAAEASLCAADQGKFWEMHDAMFANQQALSVEQLKAKAAQLRLNAGQFNSCLDSSKHARAIQVDIEQGAAAGVTGTPSMFVNGRSINGPVPLEQIVPVIDDELRRKVVR